MATYPDGTLLKASGPEVDRMEGGQRRWIPDPATFTSMGLNWGAIQTIADSDWDLIPKGAPYPSRADGALLQGSGPQIYVMAGGQRHWIPDAETFNAHWYNWNAIQHVSDADLTAIPEGIQLPSVHTVGQTYAVNCGGSASDRFLPDQFFSDFGNAAAPPNAPPVDTSGVTNPAPQAVYQSERFGFFTYTIPNLIPVGRYTVRLHFNEYVFSQPGQRIFNVALNGTTVLSAFDIIAQAGGWNKPIVKEFSATASSAGQITIKFGPASVNSAKVCGIEIIPFSYAVNYVNYAVNCGEVVDRFLPDQFVSGDTGIGINFSPAPVDTSGVTNPAPQAVYQQSERVGQLFTYTIPNLIPAKNYTVRLHFNEFYFSQPGQRIFNVALNGATVLSAFDIIAQAGRRNKAIVKEFSATASNAGQITIQFGPTSVNSAKVSGIEVIEVSPV